MPLVYIPKPRRFHYEPRFYDPDKERWEALKAKHAIGKEEPMGASDEELEYFQERVQQLDDAKAKKYKLTWKDAFRKREMPEFHYTPRFSTDAERLVGEPPDTATERVEQAKERHIRIKRRFDLSRQFQRKQQTVWIKVAVVLMVFYLVYRYYGNILQFFYNLVY